MNRFPEWGSYTLGIAPVLAISASYVVLVALGHWVMWLNAGPVREDRLDQRANEKLLDSVRLRVIAVSFILRSTRALT